LPFQHFDIVILNEIIRRFFNNSKALRMNSYLAESSKKTELHEVATKPDDHKKP